VNKRVRIIVLVLALAFVAGVLGASKWAAGKVRDKLITTGAVAGLRVEVGDVSISPFGTLTVRKLKALRVDDTEAFAIDRIEAHISPTKAFAGKRRPDTVAVHQPRLHTRVVDGQARELNRWARVVRQNLRRARGARRSSSKKTSKAPWPAVQVVGGVVRVDVIGKYAAAAPEGVAVRDIDVTIDPSGQGTASASLLSPVQTHWRGKVQPAEDGTPWVSLQANVPLRYALPDAVAELTGTDAVEVGGGGWTRATGPYLTRVRALVGDDPAAEIGRFSVTLTGVLTAVATNVMVHPANWLRDNPKQRLPQWLLKMASAPGGKVEIARVEARKLLAMGGDRVELRLIDGAASIGQGAVRSRARSVKVEAPLEAIRKLAAPMIRVRAEGLVASVAADHALTPTIPLVGRLAASWPHRVAAAEKRQEDARLRSGSNRPGWPNPIPLLSRRDMRKKARAQRRKNARRGRRRRAPKAKKTPKSASRTPLERARELLEINLKRKARADAKLREARDTGNSRLIRKAAKAARRWEGIVARYRRNVLRKKAATTPAQPPAKDPAESAPDKAKDGKSVQQPIAARLAAMANEYEPPQPAKAKPTATEERAELIARRSQRLKGRDLPYTKRFVKPLKQLHKRLAIDLDAQLVTLADRIEEFPHVLLEDAVFELVAAGDNPWRLGVRAKRARVDPRPEIPSAVEAELVIEVGKERGGNLEVALDRTGSSGRILWRLDLDKALGPVMAAEEPVGIAPDASLRFDGEAMFGGVGGVHAQGHLQATGIGIDWWRFAPGPITDLSIETDWQIDATTRPRAIDIALGRVSIGDFAIATRARVHRLRHAPVVDFHIAMPRQDCAAAARSIPRTLLPTIGDIQAVGTVDWWLDLQINVAHPWFSELAFQLNDKHCRVTSLGRVDVGEMSQRFTRKVNEDGKTLEKVEIGPGSGSWTSLGEMPRWVPYAMTTTEDGSFWAHRGLNEFLLNRAVRLDLHYGRFVYGGSTLTQQLVKNLYMTRSKFLARKFEELLIVWAMERNVKKARILEIYTNAVEFGPKMYGVKRAAKHYFDKSPSRLTPLEAAFLGSIKPCPRCADFAFRAQVYKPWYQRRVLQILTRMLHYKVITQAQYDREMNTVPRFTGWPPGKLAQRFAWPIPEVNKPTAFDKAKEKRGIRGRGRQGT